MRFYLGVLCCVETSIKRGPESAENCATGSLFEE